MPGEAPTKEEAWRDADDGAKERQNRLVEENVGLVYFVLKRFYGKGYDMEELFQVGSVGLVKAAGRFEKERGLAFSTYAVPLIIGEIRRFLRDDGMLHVSRQIKEDAGKITAIREDWKKTKNREPTLEELERKLHRSREEVVMAIGSMQEVTSIQQPAAGSDGGRTALTVADALADERDEQDALVNRLAVRQLLEELDAPARELITLRYLRGMTQNQVAECMGMNQVAVSRLEKKILLQLRNAF